MTGSYVINSTNASLKQWLTFSYEKTLNAMSNSQIALDGVTGGYKSEFDVDSNIEIYKNGTLKFRGTVFDKDDMIGGGVVLSLLGIEHELTESKSPMVGSLLTRTWTSTSDHAILSTLVTSVAGWTIDTSNSTDTNVDFRTSSTESVWNAAIRLISDGGKDINIDQANKKVYLYDELTRDDQFAFLEGKNASNISRKKSRSKASKVIVYGKGDGENQIVGSTGSGVPVFVVIDRNIVTTTQANTRAVVEYNKINPQQKSYTLNPTSAIDALQIGDMGNITNNSASINEDVDIVRIKVSVDGTGNEKFAMGVANPAFRLASKNVAELTAKQEASYNQSQSSMQGSGNLNSWGSGINAKTNFPLKVIFYLSADQIQDEAGNLRVNSLTVDYDIDKFQQQYGTASFDGSDPQVQENSDLTAPAVEDNSGQTAPAVEDNSGQTQPDVINNSEAISYGATIGSDSNNGVSCSSGAWTTLASVRIDLASSASDDLICTFFVTGNSGGAEDIQIGISNTNMSTGIGPFGHMVAGSYHDGFRDTSFHINTDTGCGVGGGSFEFIELEVYPFTGAITLDGGITIKKATHSHGPGSYDADNHLHNEGTYNAINHLHDEGTYNAINHLHANGLYDINAADIDNISIGDDVSEAGSVNASSVNLYLDFWNGSAWINKHSILATGVTIDTDVDITDSGTYPDSVGYWRVRVEPITATADFAQGIVKLKSSIDN